MLNLEGAILSDYLLLECISRGSVADVYRARQNDGPYEVAVKVFRPAYAGREAFRAYFLHEAEKIGQFDHPHILPFIEYGEGEGLLYSVTPFVKSGTLEELLKKVGGKFPAMQALPIVQQLCSAVQYAHDYEVMHGNIKPRNIFVANDGRMLLADFGIARGYAEGQQAGQKMEWGAVQYAAPEQSLGLLRRASDVYALGSVFFRILTGSPVFVGQTPVEVLLQHVRQAPPLARSIDSAISDAVDEVLQKALNKRADDRYKTALELSRAFAEAVALAPVASPVARTFYPAPQPVASVSQAFVPASIVALSSQSTAPILPTPVFQASQSSGGVAPLSSELRPQRSSQLSALPEQHDLPAPVALRPSQPLYAPLSPSPVYRLSSEPVEWSPLARESDEPGGDPFYASEYGNSRTLDEAPEELKPERPSVRGILRKTSTWLPILVLALLLLGLLAALLSSFLLPPPPSGGTGLGVGPGWIVSPVSRAQLELRG